MVKLIAFLLAAALLAVAVLLPGVPAVKEDEAGGNLSRVKVAVLYERVTDRVRDLDEVIAILEETHAELVFRGFWRWVPCPNRCGDLPARQTRERCGLRGYSYAHLEEAIPRIKAELPHVIFVGAVPAQIVHRRAVWNPKTGEVIRYPHTWELALDPAKWGLPMSKEEFQCRFGRSHFWVPRDMDCSLYDPAEAPAYFPDITNPEFQELLLSWAERQIDAGADGIWIDMLFRQASILARLAGDTDHPAVKETYEAIHKIVDQIHAYGATKGKRVYVGSWATAAVFPHPPPSLDFITVSPSAREVRELRLDGEKWDALLAAIHKTYGDVPILAFIDWAGTTETPLGQFSQVLSPEEQREFLRLADEFFAERGVVFVYPVHGGWMGHDAEILSFGSLRAYDFLAPEFRTYETIVELAQARAGETCCEGCQEEPCLPANLPPEYEQAYEEVSTWLDRKLVEWRPSEFKPMHFMGFHLPLSGALRDFTDLDDDLRFLEMLTELGVDVLSLGIVGTPEELDPALLDRYDQVIAEARQRGPELKLWLRSFMYGPRERPWKVLRATEFIINRWHPEYFAIVHEPKAEGEQAWAFVQQWVEAACELAKRLDPDVKTSATALNSEQGINYVDVFVEIPCLDIVGFDIYNLRGLCEECPGGNVLEEKIELIRFHDKEAWVEEFWLTTQWNRQTAEPTDMFPGFNDPCRAWWDARFLRVMAYYAQKNHLLGIEPWFTTYFVLYPGYDIWEFKGSRQVPTACYLMGFREALAQGGGP